MSSPTVTFVDEHNLQEHSARAEQRPVLEATPYCGCGQAVRVRWILAWVKVDHRTTWNTRMWVADEHTTRPAGEPCPGSGQPVGFSITELGKGPIGGRAWQAYQTPAR